MTKADDTIKAERNAKAAERMRKWRAANPQSPDQRAKAAEKSRKWRQVNKQRHQAYMRAWRDANREKVSFYQRARRQKARAAKNEASSSET
ncbi:hypothetical protein N8E89_24365 (plasmid) [Phyllobacterium sp. A18/5-2]|uniref:hypothetical protein n=1 Tax=Phyllobacterium sp. A18/5-2 TaxID=2978392 RepID=UPI0021C88766|nr:hypothetical protein [Phyllobacterium sp. A18/5-2]UXN66304.1 hypothetical protein N8E89_24365 [Phyllobacterium sp. A18/5-2]